MTAKRATAADRTINMFSGSTPIEEREVEVIEPEAKEGERKSLEADADRLRENAFKGQEWTTKFFGLPESMGNEYRCTLRGEYYYLETLMKGPGAKEAHGYTGVMIHKRDLMNAVSVLVQAARELKKEGT